MQCWCLRKARLEQIVDLMLLRVLSGTQVRVRAVVGSSGLRGR